MSSAPPPKRRFVPGPMETTIRSFRRAAPPPVNATTAKSPQILAAEPLETRARSSRRKPIPGTVPVPVETTAVRGEDRQSPVSHTAPQRRIAPEAVEPSACTDQLSPQAGGAPQSRPPPPPPRRKFAPQLIETAKRTRRSGHVGTVADHGNKSKAGRCENAPPSDFTLRHRPHALRVPGLDTIDSSGSEDERTPSLSTSASAGSDSEQPLSYYHATRRRESVDEISSGYLLEIAAKAAEKQIMESAMTMFCNECYHEPISHFAGETDDDNVKKGHRGLFTPINQGHIAAPSNQRGNAEHELKRIQRGAQPPMLGGDIVFARCRSPEPARFDVTQGSEALRNSMCYLTEQSKPPESEGLWWHAKKSDGPGQTVTKPNEPTNDRASNMTFTWSRPRRHPSCSAGLWNGCCLRPGSGEATKQAGMLTPRLEVDHRLESPPPTPTKEPASPIPFNADMAAVGDRLAAQKALEDEFNDAFVTQVYNYLSLGYPALALKFDDELSRISRIPVEELRQDDQLAAARGYIRRGEEQTGQGAATIAEDACLRWRALKIYIHEWAKQQPRMHSAGFALGGFGVGARRGSWAW